ncbi:hypothetical protein ACJMK2_027609 [Sinanodonta woodiana]|uniref:Centrosomal protein of 85 kDa-like CC4 coiled-coil domain-containing protein n=1 Tax=Sinanodonta woodiana TaxID=1069815 RepID=A0ABD3X4G8_SINWO
MASDIATSAVNNHPVDNPSLNILALREENELQKDQIEDLTEKLTESQQSLTEKEITIQELESKQQKLAEKVVAVTKEIQRIKSEGEGKALQQTQEELEQVKEDKERLALDLEKARKLLETNHRRLRQLELKHQNDFRQLEERLLQEEEAVHALREEARLKDEQIQKLKKTIKELASKNQDLMDQNLILKEQIKHMEQQTTDDNQRLQRQLVHEMGICFLELQSLIQICMERAEGKDPNMSLLLGVRSSVMDDDEGETGAVGGDGRRVQREGQTLKQWLSKVKELREEVDRLRSMICNKYAEDLGENINCVVQ